MMNSLILGQENLLQLEFNPEILGEFWCSLREVYPHRLKRDMERILANRDFQHFHPSKQRIEIDWMSNMTCVALSEVTPV
jgi:hypothetical protein